MRPDARRRRAAGRIEALDRLVPLAGMAAVAVLALALYPSAGGPRAATGDGPVAIDTLGGVVNDLAGSRQRLFLAVGAKLYCLEAPASGGVPVLAGVTSALEAPLVSVAVDGDLAYAALASGALAVIDVSRLAAPWVRATAGFDVRAVRVVSAGGLVYYAAEEHGRGVVRILDASGPGSLAEIARLSEGIGSYVGDIAVTDGLLFVAAGSVGVGVWDVSDPARPRAVGWAEDVRALRLDVDRGLLGVLVNRVRRIGSGEWVERGLAFFEVSGTGGLEARGQLWLDANLVDLAVRDAIAYVQAAGTVFLVDARDPTAPVRVGESLAIAPSAVLVGKPYLYGDRLFVGRGAGALARETDGDVRFECLDVGVSTVDVRQEEAIELVGAWGVPVPGETRVVAGEAQLLAVGDRCGVRLLDVSRPAAPVQRSIVGAWEYYEPTHLALDGERLVLLDGLPNLSVVDVADAGAPTVLSRMELRPADPGNRGGVRALAAGHGRAVVLSHHGYITVVDVSDPTAPAVVFDGKVLPSATRAGVLGQDLLYAATDYGLAVVDLSVPARPVWLGSGGRPMRALAVGGELAFGAVGIDTGDRLRQGLLDILDVSRPDRPEVSGSLDAIVEAGSALASWSVSREGDLVVITTGTDTVHVVDVDDPTDPRVRAAIELPSIAWGAVTRDGVVHVAGGASGLVVVEGALGPAPPRMQRRIALPVLLRGR